MQNIPSGVWYNIGTTGEQPQRTKGNYKMENQIDKNVMKYIPRKLHEKVASCDRYERYPVGYGYNVVFQDDETAIFADSVAGLKWACSEVLKGRTGTIYG